MVEIAAAARTSAAGPESKAANALRWRIDDAQRKRRRDAARAMCRKRTARRPQCRIVNR
jgi:hypothetical protein